MKKIIAVILSVFCIGAMFAGCGVSDALNNQTKSTEAATDTSEQESEPSIKDTDFNNDFDGLCNYMAAKGYIVAKAGDKIDDKNVTEMDASLVGAENGKKFVANYNGKNVTVELYSYNNSELNDTAKQIIESVKKDGIFSILEFKPVKAYLSDNGKYLMVYSDSSIDENKTDDENYKHREQAVEDFKAFYND